MGEISPSLHMGVEESAEEDEVNTEELKERTGYLRILTGRWDAKHRQKSDTRVPEHAGCTWEQGGEVS